MSPLSPKCQRQYLFQQLSRLRRAESGSCVVSLHGPSRERNRIALDSAGDWGDLKTKDLWMLHLEISGARIRLTTLTVVFMVLARTSLRLEIKTVDSFGQPSLHVQQV